MLTTATHSIDELIRAAVGKQDEAELRRQYSAQDEFVVVPDFLPAEVLEQWESHLPSLVPQIHRNYLPGHKKGGSVAYDTVRSVAPAITGVYHSQELLQFLRRIAGAQMQECPPNDPHRCAFYAYTEEGDHMGFHYDTSYYKDRRCHGPHRVVGDTAPFLVARQVIPVNLRDEGRQMVLPLLQNFRWQKIWHDHKLVLCGILASQFSFVVFADRGANQLVNRMSGSR